LHAELQITPCSPRCPVWLLYGIQPKSARHSMTPGRCKGKAHQLQHLGIAGRRVLISRKWSNKTLDVSACSTPTRIVPWWWADQSRDCSGFLPHGIAVGKNSSCIASALDYPVGRPRVAPANGVPTQWCKSWQLPR
jgi:hypothetical protein